MSKNAKLNSNFGLIGAMALAFLSAAEIRAFAAEKTAHLPKRQIASENEIIDTPESYLKTLINCNRHRKTYQVQNLFGRISHNSASEWKTIRKVVDEGRDFTFYLGPDGMEALLNSRSTFEFLLRIGYTPDYIDRTARKEKKIFKVIVFKECCNLKPATWDHILEVVRIHYPDVYKKVEARLEEIKTTPFSEIDRQVPLPEDEQRQQTRLDYIFSKRPNHPLYIDYDKLKASSAPALWEVRAFLYNILRLTDLFSGTGDTMDENHHFIFKEYLGKNMTFAELPDAEIIPIDVAQ